jgi:PAS domain S-box-containing protein
MTLRAKLAAACGGALVLFCWVGLLSYRSMLHVDEDQRWIAHTYTVLGKLDALLTDLISAESNQRNHVFTGKQSYLSAYKSDLDRLRDNLNDVGRLTSDNPRQQQALQQLRPLISTKLSEFQESLTIRGPEGAKSDFVVRGGMEKQSLPDITSRITQMKEEESRLLIQRSQDAQKSSFRMKGVIVFGNILATLLLGAAAFAIFQEMSRRSNLERELHRSEERFRLMVSSVKEYAILMLDPSGCVVSWNAGAERIKGYGSQEIIGQHFSCFYPAEDIERGKPEQELKVAAAEGQVEDEGWRVRKDGSRFWANVVMTALRDPTGRLQGFSKVTRDLTERRHAEEETKRQNAQLEAANKELDAFGYSVAHDLRAPLRAIDGFSLAILQDFQDQIPAEGAKYLQRIRAGAQRMAQLIEDLLKLARISRYEIVRNDVDLSSLAREVTSQLQTSDPDRQVKVSIAPGVVVTGDRNLLRIVLENLVGNAWKFTSGQPRAEIELGVKSSVAERVLFIRDNGPGFDMEHAGKLFGVFQRLHRDSEFPGTGVGLATVQRIVHRHGGRIWADAAVGKGATFYFVL